MYNNVFKHFYNGRYVDYFLSFVITNKEAKNNLVHISVHIYGTMAICQIHRSRIDGSKGIFICNVIDIVKLPCIKIVPIYIHATFYLW